MPTRYLIALKAPLLTFPFPFADPLEDPVQPENAIVPESGEESEDEWNYIKVNQKATEPETQERNLISQEPVEPESLCPDVRQFLIFPSLIRLN